MKAKKLFPNDAQPADMERFYAASIILQRRALPYACMLMQMDVIWTRAIGTAATDGCHVYINPDFFLSLDNDEQRAFLLGHEIGHVVLRHVERAEFYNDRGFHSIQKGKQLPFVNRFWNIAGDLVINADLKATGLQPLPMGLYDDAVSRDHLVDDVYVNVYQEQPEGGEGGQPGNEPEDVPDNPGKSDQPGGEPSEDESDDESGAGSAEGDDADDESAESEGGSATPADDDDDSESGSAKGGKPGHGGFDDHLTPEYEDGEGNPLEGEELDRAKESDAMEIDETIREADEQARRQSGRPGTGHGIFGNALNDRRAKEAQVDWRTALAEYVSKVCNSGRTDWSRVNRRRFCVTGVLTPSHQGVLTRLVTVVDRSGSALRCLPIFMTEMGRILDATMPLNGCQIVWTDTEVMKVDEVFNSGDCDAIESVPRGGGTYLSPALDYIGEQGWDDAEVIIVLTDGEMDDSDLQNFADRGALMVLDSDPGRWYRETYEKMGLQYIVCHAD